MHFLNEASSGWNVVSLLRAATAGGSTLDCQHTWCSVQVVSAWVNALDVSTASTDYDDYAP